MKRRDRIELVVRRGALRRFQSLKDKTGTLPVKVLWDRRVADRRASATTVSSDLRKAERRQPPPFTWDLADFVIVARNQRGRTRKAEARSKKKSR